MKKYNYLGFTLVELIVVITIMAILGTISFLYFNSYVSGSRDSKRVVDVKSVSTSLEVYYKKNNGIYPKPSDFIITSYTGSDGSLKSYSYLGYVSDDIGLSFNKVPSDPITGDKYQYATTVDNKYYEIACTLEQYPEKSMSYISNLYADTSKTVGDFAYVEGNYKKDLSIGHFIDHIVLMSQSGSQLFFPKDNLVIGSFSGSDFQIGTGFVFIEHYGEIVPYPINDNNNYSDLTSTGTSDFIIETDFTGVSLNCPNCE